MVGRPKPSFGSTFSTRSLLKMSDQLSSPVMRRPCAAAASARPWRSQVVFAERGEKIDAGIAREGFRHRQPLGIGEGIGPAAAPGQFATARRLGGDGEEPRAIVDQDVVRFAGPIPFEHGEFGMVQHPALAVAEHFGEGENAAFSGRQEFLAGKFRRCLQVEPAPATARILELGRKSADVRLVAGRDLENGGLHLAEPALGKMGPPSLHDPLARLEKGAAVGVDMGRPPGGSAEGRP